MIEYIIDKEDKYTKDILFHLREHNQLYAGEYIKKSYNLYCIQNGELLGGMKVTSVWNWAGISSVFYNNTEILKSMVSKLQSHLDQTIIGIKTITEVKDRYNDFVKIGFRNEGIVKVTESETWYYIDLKNSKQFLKSNYEVLLTEETMKEYDDIIKSKEKEFDRKYNVCNGFEAYNIVAMNGNDFYGSKYRNL